MRIGILGGTFNPVHMGHIRLAEEAKAKLKLDKLIFVPAYIPPHKMANREILPFGERYKMVELAIRGRDGLEVSDIEERLKGASYSISTIKEFKRLYSKEAEIFFITGSDSIEELASWKDVDELKKICKFIIATRPGYAVGTNPKDTTVIEIDTPDISSSEIRRCIKEGRDFKEEVPIKVYRHIIKSKLYLGKTP